MERIGHEVERTLKGSGSASALVLAEVTAAWPRAVGAEVARQAWPLRLGRDGTLHVATASSTWAFELDRLSAEIAVRLGSMLGEAAPQKLRFRVGPIPEAGPSREAPAQPEPGQATSPEAVSAAASAAAEIDDPELRELAARAARASLARGRSGRAF
jgi:predicted nucleic acid-binding Zn ribbon protein